MKKIYDFILFFSLLTILFTFTYAASSLPDIEVDPKTGDITFTFYNGPSKDEGKITKCPEKSRILCKKVVTSNGNIVVGPSGYNDLDTYIPAGSLINLFIFTSENPNVGNRYVNITLLNDYYPNIDNETEFTQEPGQNIYHNYSDWEQIVY